MFGSDGFSTLVYGISLAAGVTIATFESILEPSIPVLRSMPNTPALVGRGVTGLASGTTAGGITS